MALRLSTGLRKKMMAGMTKPSAALCGTNLAFVDGGASADTITDSGGRFLTAGFLPGRYIKVSGATTSGNNGTFLVVAVTANTITLATGTLAGSEAAAADTIICQASGVSMLELFQYGVIRGFAGTQPATADKSPSGTLLVQFTLNAADFTPGSIEGGLIWEDGGDGTIVKPDAASWQGLGLNDGTIGWFRVCDNACTTGDSTDAIRIDGSVSITGAQMTGSSVVVKTGATSSLDSATLSLPTL